MAVHVILFALFGFLVSHDPAAGVVFLGLFAVVFSYSLWPTFGTDSGRLGLTREILKTCVVLLTMLGIAITLQGLSSLTGFDVLDTMGRAFSKLIGVS